MKESDSEWLRDNIELENEDIQAQNKLVVKV